MREFDQTSRAAVEAQPASIAHTCITLLQVAIISLIWKLGTPPPENVTATWGEVAQSKSSEHHRFCLYANDSMSDNLQRHLMPFKPPDRMTTFISDTFSVPCFTHNLQSATEEMIQLLLSFPYLRTDKEKTDILKKKMFWLSLN